MPGLYEIRWLPDGRTQKFVGSRGNYYELSESDRLDLHSVPVWCHGCEKVTHGEELSSVEEIDREIRDLRDPTSDRHRMMRNGVLEELLGEGGDFVRDRIAELLRRRHWRERRQAPAKCIHCGTARITPLPLGEWVANPGGDGQISVRCIGMCSTAFNEWFFTGEGDRIPRDTRPTYWHHPELDRPGNRERLMTWIKSKMRGGGPTAD